VDFLGIKKVQKSEGAFLREYDGLQIFVNPLGFNGFNANGE
jgi:hypothetical protein